MSSTVRKLEVNLIKNNKKNHLVNLISGCILTLRYKKIKTNKIFVQHHLQYSITTNSLLDYIWPLMPNVKVLTWPSWRKDRPPLRRCVRPLLEVIKQGGQKSSHDQFTVSQQWNSIRSFSDLISNMQEPAQSGQFVSEAHGPSHGLCRITRIHPADGKWMTNTGK